MIIKRGASLVMAVLTVGCGAASTPSARPGESPSIAPTRSSSATPSSSGDVTPAPSPSGLFAVTADHRKLALACWGHGSPAVVLDAGSFDAGLARWRASALLTELAMTTTVCTYDRAGLGESEPAPRRARVLDDVTQDLHALLKSASIPRPVVMVGASGGGFNVYHHAGRYPADVAGLVLLDVPAGQRSMSHSDGPPEWSDPANTEHVDYYAVEHQMAVARLKVKAIPVTVVTARNGQSADPAEQRVWLAGSSRPVHVVVEGGHDIAFDATDRVLEEILAVVAAA